MRRVDLKKRFMNRRYMYPIIGLILIISCSAPEVVPEKSGLRLAGVLENTQYRFREISWIKKTGFFDKGELVFRYYIDVRAGVDLQRAEQSVEGDTLTMSLPEPIITTLDMDENSLKVLFEDKLYFKSLKHSEWGSVVEERKEAVAKEALERGIIEEARIQTEQFIRVMAESSGFSHVEFSWQEYKS